jgi:hypothetical protein
MSETAEEHMAELVRRIRLKLNAVVFSGPFSADELRLWLSFDNFKASAEDVTAALRKLVASGEVDVWMYCGAKKD